MIRLYSDEDKPDLLESIRVLQDFERQFDPAHMLAGSEMAEAWLRHTLEENATHDGLIFVATVNGNIAGFTSVRTIETSEEEAVYLQPAKRAFVSDVQVFPTYRGHGVGKTLMGMAAQYAHSRQLEGLTLSVIAGNEAGLSFYEELGYRPYMITMVLDFL